MNCSKLHTASRMDSKHMKGVVCKLVNFWLKFRLSLEDNSALLEDSFADYRKCCNNHICHHTFIKIFLCNFCRGSDLGPTREAPNPPGARQMMINKDVLMAALLGRGKPGKEGANEHEDLEDDEILTANYAANSTAQTTSPISPSLNIGAAQRYLSCLLPFHPVTVSIMKQVTWNHLYFGVYKSV